MRTPLLCGMLFISVLFPQWAQAHLVSGHSVPQDGTFSIRMPDGTLIVADAHSQRLYLSGTNGALSEVTFEQAVVHAEPDPSKRAVLLASINSALTHQDSAGAFAIALPMTPEPLCWDSSECHIQVVGDGAVIQSDHYNPDAELPKPVDLDHVTVLGMRPQVIGTTGGLGVYYSSGSAGNYQNSSGSVSYQQYYADDYNRWQRNRSAACDAAHIQSFVVGGMLAGTVGACGAAAASGGFAAMACGGMVVATIAAWGQMAASSKTCASTYPGPGNW